MSEPTLIIDDDPNFNAILVRSLERRGYSARGAGEPAGALALAREIMPTRVVLDLNLNGSSGLALIQELDRACRDRDRIIVSLSPERPARS